MKDEQKKTFKWISFRVTPNEYDQVYSHLKKSGSRKMSDYARKVLLKKPVVVTYRNQSTDDFLTLATALFKTLNGIGNNFNQAVKKLHTLREIPEFKSWFITWNLEQKILQNKIEEVKKFTIKIYEDGRQNHASR
jgi:hypothetical protein